MIYRNAPLAQQATSRRSGRSAVTGSSLRGGLIEACYKAFSSHRNRGVPPGCPRRALQLEHLEHRVVLSANAVSELFAPICTPLETSPVGSAARSLPVYGPLTEKEFDLMKSLAGGDGALDKLAVASPRLQPPDMPGLATLSSSVAGAVAAAWDIPAESLTNSWVVGLTAGHGRESLQQLGFESVEPTPYLPNTFVLQFAQPQRVAALSDQFLALDSVSFFYPQIAQQQSTRAVPNDTLFGNQWHLQNTGQSGGTVGADANIVDVWDMYTGGGVVIGVVDDGLEHAHPDLAANYDAALSYDFNDNDLDPTPLSSDTHGTSVAGVAAGVGNNGLGISGAAPDATLAGLRLLAGAISDSMEADALTYQNQSIDIYSNSWGPPDFGELGAPGPLVVAAFESAVTSGRGGLGSIYTWAAGNGLSSNDNVNYDGYANSRFTVAVAAIDHDGVQSNYSEPGAPILVTAYSSGDGVGITTTTVTGRGNLQDPPGSADYTSSFGGTSSATPLVSGVIALMLEANPNLTWRDVQHVLVNSASQNDPGDADWTTNGAGHLINHKYGFGAIDAQAAVALAESWATVAQESSATTGLVTVGQPIPDNDSTGVVTSVNVSDALRVEQVEVVLNATHPYRGDLRVVLTSPSGTESILAEPHSDGGADYNSWVFTSARHWDELSNGEWTLKVSDEESLDAGTFDSWQLNIYGTLSDVEDFGDAPDEPYGTLLISNGPHHLLGGPLLGATVDPEEDGQPSADATGDGADEDGVVFVDPLVPGGTAYLQVTSSPGGGTLDYFFDFDASGGFGNTANEVFSTVLAGGAEMIAIDVPADAVAGSTFARFRISSDGGLGPDGAAADGEVEDYAITIFATPPPRDFGDAPDALYATLRADGGPSHIVGGPQLGAAVDVEADGQANPVATGDGTDEDGVHFPDLLVAGQSAPIQITSSAGGGVLDFFFDFNANGVFGDSPSEVFQAALSGGPETILVAVPADAVPGTTVARFRLSSDGGLGPLGLAADGEVEDYQVVILSTPSAVCTAWTYFDDVTAPALPAGWTSTSTAGVNWTTVGSGSDTPPNHAFVADVSSISENRLASPAVDIVDGINQVRFRHSYNMENGYDGGVLEISIGGGARQDILDAGGAFVAGGYDWDLSTLYSNPLGGRNAWTGNSGGYIDTVVELPAAVQGQSIQLFWIEGTDSSVSADGWHVDTIELCQPGEFSFDFGDAPDPTYPTLSSSGGAAHAVGGTLVLGSLVDADTDGQPDGSGLGDDGDANGDDEDGITFTSSLVAGSSATLDVTASEPGLLSAWIDFNGDGDWADAGEQVFQDLLVAAGTQSLAVDVPADAVAGASFARFRLSTQSGLSFTGLAPDGEVEDYAVTIEQSAAPVVESVVVGDGTASRSMVTQVTVTFDQIMVLDAGVFQVNQRGTGGGAVDVAFSSVEIGGKTVATLVFSGAFVDNATSGSLADGNYDLTIDATKARSTSDAALDGNGDGTGGDNFQFGTSEADAFFRMFGDGNGTRNVDFLDFFALRNTFGKRDGVDPEYDARFDWNASGNVDFLDFFAFRSRFGTRLDFE